MGTGAVKIMGAVAKQAQKSVLTKGAQAGENFVVKTLRDAISRVGAGPHACVNLTHFCNGGKFINYCG